MGIKNIHIGFICASVAIALLCGAWLLWTENGREIEHSTLMAVVSFVSAPLMVFYGVRFIRKAQREGLD